jgi:hypothetical protein
VSLEVKVLYDLTEAADRGARTYDRWVIASQDCDLDTSDITSAEATIEARPVSTGNPNADWGIRSRILRLSDDAYIEASSPRLNLSPKVLASLDDAREPPIDPGRAEALKTWLGLRYDRPAVPPQYVDLAREIAGAVRRTRSAELSDRTHDVLMQFSEGSPPRFVLVAVAIDGVNAEGIAQWLVNASLQIPAELGVLGQAPTVLTKRTLSIQFLEDSYAADLSAVTWRKSSPSGAT